MLLESTEFREEVLHPLMLRHPFPAGRFPDTPPLALIHWAQTTLPINARTRLHLGLARTWALLLEALLADLKLMALAPELLSAGVATTLAERVARDPAFQACHHVVGSVDSASAFEIRGWAVDTCRPGEPLTVEILADGGFIGAIDCDLPRPDVADVVGGNGQVGFAFQIPAAHRRNFAGGCKLSVRAASTGQTIGHDVAVQDDAAHAWDTVMGARQELRRLRETIERIEAALPDLSRMASLPLDAYDEYWDRFYRPSPDVLDRQRRQAGALSYQPQFAVVMPTWNGDPRLIDAAIESVRAQSWPHWALYISDDASDDSAALAMLARRHADEPRIQFLQHTERGGIATNTNRAIAAAQGDYVVFLDHDDLLTPDALFCVADCLQQQRYDWLYSDEDRLEADARGVECHHSPFFKPDFDPDLLLGLNYICHLVVVRADVLAAVQGLRTGVDGAQDHDLLLRLAAYSQAAIAQPTAPETTAVRNTGQPGAQALSNRIHHIPRVLYHWRVVSSSVSQDLAGQQKLRRTIVQVVDEHLHGQGQDAMVEMHNDAVGSARLFANRIRWRLPSPPPAVSIIIPTRDRLDLLRPCVDSVLESLDAYRGQVEVIIADNDSREADTLAWFAQLRDAPQVRLLPCPGAFNYSAINNAAARAAQGNVLVFLNNDTRVLSADWLDELVSLACRPEVGAVGTRLLYQDGTLQHAGVLIGLEGVAGHEGLGESPRDGGYYGRSHLLRNASAVTAACLATRRALFLHLGGFDELHLQVAFNDVDFCLRVREAGYRLLYTPFATLYHYESKSRGREITAAQQARHAREAQTLRQRWGSALHYDPYYNAHFERYARAFARLRPPPEHAPKPRVGDPNSQG